MLGEQPQSRDGVVLPGEFPRRSGNIKAENVRSASEKLGSIGQTVESRMDTIVGLWNCLPGVCGSRGGGGSMDQSRRGTRHCSVFIGGASVGKTPGRGVFEDDQNDSPGKKWTATDLPGKGCDRVSR